MSRRSSSRPRGRAGVDALPGSPTPRPTSLTPRGAKVRPPALTESAAATATSGAPAPPRAAPPPSAHPAPPRRRLSSSTTAAEAASGHATPPPHTVKNPYILRGYAVHEGPLDAVLDTLTLRRGWHNEHANIITGAAMGGVAAAVWAAAGDPALDPAHAAALRGVAAAQAFNTAAVVAYHTLLSVPWLYHGVSAADLAGVSLTALGVVAGGCVPGASTWAPPHPALPPPAAADADASGGGHPFRLTPGLFFGALSPAAAPVVHAAIIACAAAAAVSTRVAIARESPPSLIAANVVWYVVLLADYIVARWPSPVPVLVLALLAGGAAIYGAKWPERLWPGVADLGGHSHSIWHVAYVSAFAVYAADVVGLAFAAVGAAGEAPVPG
jgi:hypothetical protein